MANLTINLVDIPDELLKGLYRTMNDVAAEEGQKPVVKKEVLTFDIPKMAGTIGTEAVLELLGNVFALEGCCQHEDYQKL